MKAQRIALFGNFGSVNLGNEGSLDAMVRFLRSKRPEAEIICICRDPKRVSKNHSIATHPLKRLWTAPRWVSLLDKLLLRIPSRILDLGHVWRIVRGIDVLLIPGTGILDDYQERPSEMPLELFQWCGISAILKRPILFVSVGAGPIRNRISRLLMVSAAKLASYRSYRDAMSKAYLSAQGVDTSKDDVYPDLVFALPVIHEAGAAQHDSARTGIIGVGVMSYFGWISNDKRGHQIYSDYLEKISQFVEWLLSRGYGVRLLIGSESDNATVKAIGDRVAKRFGTPSANSLLAEPAESLEELMRQMKATDAIVATRFHNVVCALKCAKPVLSISYAGKNDELLEKFGLADFVQQVENLNLELLIRQFEKLEKDRVVLSTKIRGRIQLLQKSLDQQYAHLLDVLS
ncbi:MAG: polysaccharide pyruvyl transferase family protein [Proteobacteria bacterium]|nr:polysaccharide pyruvyl transferase family protein [Pseudomonadota bacterium]